MDATATAENITPMQPATTARQHKTQRVPTGPLKLFMDDFNVSEPDMCKALYQSTGTVRQWLVDGNMPGIALVALEGLRRRRQDSNAILLVRPGAKLDTVRTVLTALGVEPHEV